VPHSDSVGQLVIQEVECRYSGTRNIGTAVVCASLVHCCAVKKNVIVASQLYDVADVQFTVD